MFRTAISTIRTALSAHKVAATITTVGVAAVSLVVVGGKATFNDSQTQAQSVGTRALSLQIGSAGTAANRLSIGASGLIPGDTVQRVIDIQNTSAFNYSSLTLTTTAAPSSLLDTDATNGLQMVIDECSVAWTESGSNPNYSYTCSGTTTPRITTRAVIGSSMNLGGGALAANTTGKYRVTLTLPSSAGNTFASLNSTISYAFTAVL
jgi:spore coat-associated protein N